MKKVPIHEVKRNLATFVSEAAKGERILITRHGRPAAALEASDREHLVVGAHAGRAKLRPALHNATRGRFLEVLAEDRRGGT